MLRNFAARENKCQISCINVISAISDLCIPIVTGLQLVWWDFRTTHGHKHGGEKLDRIGSVLVVVFFWLFVDNDGAPQKEAETGWMRSYVSHEANVWGSQVHAWPEHHPPRSEARESFPQRQNGSPSPQKESTPLHSFFPCFLNILLHFVISIWFIVKKEQKTSRSLLFFIALKHGAHCMDPILVQ